MQTPSVPTSVIFVDDDILQLDYCEECRGKAVYVYDTLKVDFVDFVELPS